MAIVVGLVSGKELLAEDRSYLFVSERTGAVKHVFIGVDKKRIYTIPDEYIEYMDESFTDERYQSLIAASEIEVIEQHDPSTV